jgi:hypothetical protein
MRSNRCRRTEIDHAIPIPHVGRSWDEPRGPCSYTTPVAAEYSELIRTSVRGPAREILRVQQSLDRLARAQSGARQPSLLPQKS